MQVKIWGYLCVILRDVTVKIAPILRILFFKEVVLNYWHSHKIMVYYRHRGYQQGGKSAPRADILRKIANALGCSMDELWPD